MRLFIRAILALMIVSLLPLPSSRAQTSSGFHLLSPTERAQISHAARLAHRDRSASLLWLRRQHDVEWAGLAPDGITIEVQFRDGALGAVFGAVPVSGGLYTAPHRKFAPRSASQAEGASRALVLEPFGTDLGLGPSSGQPEIDALTQAGFQVDVFRDDKATIKVIQTMASYSVIYIETHSGTCGPPLCLAGDIFVLTHEIDAAPYAQLFRDKSLVQGAPENDPGHLYIGFTSHLISNHVGTFPNSSIFFINGCSILDTPAFLQAITDRGASTVFTWDKKVNNVDAEAAADFIFPRLTAGENVAAALGDAHAAGLDTSDAEGGRSTLQVFGDPNNTFKNALDEATPTPTPTPVSTPTPQPKPTSTATPTPKPTARATQTPKKCKKGYKRTKVKGKTVCKKVKK
jgi:hypothetical protein